MGKCDRWDNASPSDREVPESICNGCDKQCSPPLPEEQKQYGADVRSMVDQVGYLVTWENAGRATEWEMYPFELQKLYVYWRAVEADVKQIQNARQQAYIKAQFAAPQMVPPVIPDNG